jgi:NitT/TauT family transport system permease protein
MSVLDGGARPRMDRASRIGVPIAVGLLGLGVWQLLVGVVGVSAYLLPSPAEIVGEWRANVGPIAEATWITGSNAVLGLIVGAAFAVLLAALASRFRWFDQMLVPVVAALAVVPIVALAPVLNSMFGADSEIGRRTIAAIASFVPVFLNSLRGLRQTTPLHRDLMRAYAASGSQTFRLLTLPAAAPYVVTGLRVASSLAVISALVAEYFGGPRGGLGAFISTSAATSAYARAWAYVGASILLGLGLYLLTVALERGVNRLLAGGAR